MWHRNKSQTPTGPPPCLPGQSIEKAGDPEPRAGRLWAALAWPQPSGIFTPLRTAADRARLRNGFPKSRAEGSVPEDYAGRESSTPRQTAELDKGLGVSTHLPPASPHSDCLRDMDIISVAVLTWEGWQESEEGRSWGLGRQEG